ncbi:hypothetical protein PL81_38850 [Streptomyces sp. RSD-27]|nr:hypothetical protein PL81_38850 [Streptomyces sp. RSD-27]
MTATRTAAAHTRAAAPALTLDQRLALAHHAMDDRLATRSAAWAVDTAHIPLEAPELLAPAPAPAAYPTPVATVLLEAHRLLADRGWCRRWLSDGVRACSKGAIQAAARTIGGGHGDKAEEVLLDRIRAEQPEIQSIGAWNDAQAGPAPVLAMFDRAARHADRRGI